MPHYFLHLRDGTEELLDPEGVEYRNTDALHKAVLRSARGLIAADARVGQINFDQHIDAETDAGEIVHTLQFEDAVVVRHGGFGGLTN